MYRYCYCNFPCTLQGWRWFQYYHSEPAPVDQAQSQVSISSLGLSGCCAQVRKKPSEKTLFSESNQ